MRNLRFALIQLLIFTSLALNIERLDYGAKENIVNLASFVYLLAGMAVISTILIPNQWKLTTRTIVIFWTAVYVTVKIVMNSSRPIIGGIYTYLSIAELMVLVILIVLTRRVMKDLLGLEETITNITMADVSNRVKNLEDASDDINSELVRSRRYSRPLGLLVVKLEPENIQANIDNLSEDILRTIMLRYSMSNLIRSIDKKIRRPDLILEQHRENRIILLLPETNLESAKVVADNVQRIAKDSMDSQVTIGVASFPDDAITFDDLVIQAENKIYSSEKKNLFDDQKLTEQTTQSSRQIGTDQ